MAESAEPRGIRMTYVPSAQMPPPLHAGYIHVNRIGDEIEFVLCDLDLQKLITTVNDAKSSGKPPALIDIHARGFQQVYLSKLAVPALLEVLLKIHQSFLAEDQIVDEGANR